MEGINKIMYEEEYDIVEYRNMFIPNNLRHLMGKASRQEMKYLIKKHNAIDEYILKYGKPTTLVKKLKFY